MERTGKDPLNFFPILRMWVSKQDHRSQRTVGHGRWLLGITAVQSNRELGLLSPSLNYLQRHHHCWSQRSFYFKWLRGARCRTIRFLLSPAQLHYWQGDAAWEAAIDEMVQSSKGHSKGVPEFVPSCTFASSLWGTCFLTWAPLRKILVTEKR